MQVQVHNNLQWARMRATMNTSTQRSNARVPSTSSSDSSMSTRVPSTIYLIHMPRMWQNNAFVKVLTDSGVSCVASNCKVGQFEAFRVRLKEEEKKRKTIGVTVRGDCGKVTLTKSSGVEPQDKTFYSQEQNVSPNKNCNCAYFVHILMQELLFINLLKPHHAWRPFQTEVISLLAMY